MENEKPEIIEINDDNRETILELFEIETDEEGYLMRDGETVICPHEEEKIHKDDFTIIPDEEKEFKLIKPTQYALTMEIAPEWFEKR